MSQPIASTLAGARDAVVELAPVLRRAVDLDPACLARLRLGPSTAAVYARLPFGVLVARTVSVTSAVPSHGATTAPRAGATQDRTLLARDLLSWLDGERPSEPEARDAEWRGGLPPAAGWRRIDSVPDEVIRELVRKGALALRDAAQREGVPGAQPRAEVADALLDSVVLTLTDDTDGARATVTLRSLSALTRMGFLARDSRAHVDAAGRWTRIAASYGSIFAERAGLGLGVVSR